ncbi:alpha-amylase family glycosyl hydrolase [Flavobacterium sp. SUN052]|uniref:alpha-amylase family glycosyl hydrolase n=1 Tax=Flavobacterium sp. SUN052 TaxID=3002441 RepID=UPI00237E2873|nr:alpha-amylase family glycosyl hydrolase [Flavobacterium sp. SUN052]MEC4005206.1 alpha-amylase family glycosyl hydrolase [Flavobacterium sp. SUN052]
MFENCKRIITIIILIFLLQSCSKSDDVAATITPSPTPTPTDNFVPVATADVVMYEINPLSFSSSKNIQGIINRLDNIKALGVNTIWIMPIYPVGVANSFGSPYCVKDYTSIKTSYGTLQDLKNLVTQAHAKNIAVILDWVANHTSWDNQWIYSNPSWYTHNSSGQIISPAGTNWNDVADLDYTNSAMRLAMIDAMKYWVTNANVDGFRCDAADFVPYDFWLQANTALNAIPNKHLILLAEGSRADHFTAGFQMNFAWDYLGGVKNVFGTSQTPVSNLFTTNTSEYAVVPSGKQKLRFTTNHDESNNATPISVYGSKSGALAASVITTFLQGVPLLYCGQEVGVSSTSTYNGTNTIDWTANSDMLSAYQNLFTFYNASTTARTGSLTTYPDTNVAVFLKSTASEQVLVIVNSRATAQNLTVPSALQGNWTNALTGDSVSLSGTLSFSAFQYLIVKK